MFKVGITGGIGSGKSTVCEIFESLGVPVFNADKEARAITSDPEVRKEIVEFFGEEMYVGDQLQREEMARVVFGDEQKLTKLNSIIHPQVKKAYDRWLLRHNDHPYTLKEAAILFESNGAENLDRVIVVTAPDELRIERVMKRDGVNRESVVNRMNKQWPQEELIKRSDFRIVNDGNELLIPQVLKIHRKILSL